MPLAELQAKVAAGELTRDRLQEEAAARLDQLARELEEAPRGGSGLWSRLRRGRRAPAVVVKGIYLHGGVGRGKTMLMDLFYEKVRVEAKRRVHFHAFMLEVQAKLHRLRQLGGREEPLHQVADGLAREVRLLCFDEFHVVDIADAMILGRLFEALFERGVTVVATSNWPPRRLYENGLNRDRFLPFIDLLLLQVEVVALEGPVDYRLGRLREAPVYHHPAGPEADAALEALFATLTDGAPSGPEALPVGSRTLHVPRAADGVADFTFADLCARALGAADYLALTERYHTLVLKGVPLLTADKRNEARRFMVLVDALYERRAMLLLSAAAPPEALYVAGDGAFEFQRTVSRLFEMQSQGYLERCRERPTGPGTFVPFALTSDLI